MSWILLGEIGDALTKGRHQNLRVMRLSFAQLVGEGESQDTVVIFGDDGDHAADAFKAVDAGASEDGYRRADDIAAMLGVP